MSTHLRTCLIDSGQTCIFMREQMLKISSKIICCKELEPCLRQYIPLLPVPCFQCSISHYVGTPSALRLLHTQTNTNRPKASSLAASPGLSAAAKTLYNVLASVQQTPIHHCPSAGGLLSVLKDHFGSGPYTFSQSGTSDAAPVM